MNYQYEELKKISDAVRAECRAASEVMNQFPRLPNGLTPDVVRNTPEYQAAKRDFDVKFKREQEMNKLMVKNFKKELLADRQREREEKLKSLNK